MILERLVLTHVRCHAALEVRFDRSLTVLLGPNGAGKTSVLEAAHLVLRGWSPRTSSLREVIAQDAEVLRVEAELVQDDGARAFATVGYDRSGERRVGAGGAPLPDFSRWEEVLPVRAFLPDHLQLVKGSPRGRRQYVDLLATHADPLYRPGLVAYEEALRQRNFLLRTGVVNAEHGPWEAVLAGEGLALARRRAVFLAGLSARFARMHGALTGLPPASVGLVYRTNVAGLAEEEYRSVLAEQRATDRFRSSTQLGPHRDDLRFVLADRDVREYGSQGEQRTVLLALLLAEAEWLAVEGGRAPLLLLDDVMSELDHERRRALLGLLSGGGQTVITTTTLDYFAPEELERARVVRIGPPSTGGPGRVTRIAGAVDPPAADDTGGLMEGGPGR